MKRLNLFLAAALILVGTAGMATIKAGAQSPPVTDDNLTPEHPEREDAIRS